MRDKNHDTEEKDDDDELLDERVEAIFDLLLAAGEVATDNGEELSELCRLLSSHSVDDLPDEPQSFDRPVERLIAVLETCRSLDDDEDPELSKRMKSSTRRRRSSSRKRSDDPGESREDRTNSRTTATTKSSSQQKEQEMALQDQFDKEYNSTAYPKIGPGYSETISVVSDLTTPTVMTGLAVPDEEMDYHGYYNKRPSNAPTLSRTELNMNPPRRSMTNSLRGGAAASRRMHHQATLGRLGENSDTIGKIPESRPIRASAYPSLQKTPNAFPSVFPSDDLSASLPHSPRQFDTKRLLKKTKSLKKGSKESKKVSKEEQKQQKLMMSSKPKKTSSQSRIISKRRGESRRKVDVDGVLNVIGQDIDYLFRELSVLEDDDAPPLDEESVVSESNLGKTAKLKYTLGSVARSLREQEHQAIQEEQEDEGPFKKSISSRQRARSPANSSRSSSVTQKSDPLIIDEDGFIIRDNGEDPFQTGEKAQPQKAGFDDFFPPRRRSSPEKKPSVRRRSSSSRKEGRSKSNSRSSRDSKERDGSQGTATTLSSSNRIDGVEAATKERIDMLRKMVEEDGTSRNEAVASKLDFVETETMKQIAKLRDRLGDNGQKPLAL